MKLYCKSLLKREIKSKYRRPKLRSEDERTDHRSPVRTDSSTQDAKIVSGDTIRRRTFERNMKTVIDTTIHPTKGNTSEQSLANELRSHCGEKKTKDSKMTESQTDRSQHNKSNEARFQQILTISKLKMVV